MQTRLGQSLISVNASRLHTPAVLTAHDAATFARVAAKSLVSKEEDQSIILYGRSGAGKTVTAHTIVQSLLEDRTALKDLVISAQRVSAAFTQTFTSSNDDRSTSVKVWSCRYSGSQLCGVEAWSLLLDDGLLRNAACNGYTTHVIHYLVHGLPPSKLEALGLDTLQLPLCSSTLETENKRFVDMDSALGVLGFSEEERWGIWCVLSAVVHLSMELPDMQRGASLLHVGAEQLKDVYLKSPRLLPMLLYMHLYKWICECHHVSVM